MFVRSKSGLEISSVSISLGLIALLSALGAGQSQPTNFDLFEARTDVGKVQIPGSIAYDGAKKELRMTASGANIWDKEDAFFFAWRKVSGDLTMAAHVDFVGKGKDPHRKAGWMIRQSLDSDAPYAGVSVHGDGLITLHYRKDKGGLTQDVRAVLKGPAAVRLERRGDVIALLAAKSGQEFQPVAALTVKLADLVHAGLFTCSHDVATAETAIFSAMSFDNPAVVVGKKRIQETSLEIIDVATGERNIVFRERQKFEAPNWSRDGKLLYINRGGAIYTVPVQGGKLTKLDTGDVVNNNNDHGLSPDGKWLAISHSVMGASQISIVPSTGGAARRVTPTKGHSYWHGWSPDGKTLVYTGERNKDYDIYSIPVESGAEKQLTSAKGLDDGPDFTADGKFIYFNSERTGDMKIWRMNSDGTDQQQVTKDVNYCDWFPHPSPDGKWLVWMSYDKAVKDHPANKDVVLRIMPLTGGKARALATLFGGQGTINVPSWSPDSNRLAFVSYLQVLP